MNQLVAGMLTRHFPDIWLTGEVTGLRAYPSGHLYFTLKDENAQIDAVCFRSAASRLKFKLEDGLEVVGHGKLDLYEARGKYQVVLDRVEPKGLGALQLRFEQLKKRLAAEGLFDESRKRPLPVLPRVVGIVTSAAGAAIHDMIRTLRLHRARVEVVVWPSQVQGDGAAEQVAAGIAALNDCPGVEVIIVGRGGGSLEDLWAFNEEPVARAIYASKVPVVSGVGHETDFTIADFAADVRAATPTAAAQLVAAGWQELAERLARAADELVEAAEQALLDRVQRLDELVRDRAFESVRTRLADGRLAIERGLAGVERGVRELVRRDSAALAGLRERLVRQHPAARLARTRGRLESSLGRAARAAENRLARWRERGGRTMARLDALSPLASLARGYAVCLDAGGRVVSRVKQVGAGDRVQVRVADGDIGCEVLEARPAADKEAGR